MKKFFFYCLVLIGFTVTAQTYEFKVVTTVESVVPNGLGRSRMISANDQWGSLSASAITKISPPLVLKKGTNVTKVTVMTFV